LWPNSTDIKGEYISQDKNGVNVTFSKDECDNLSLLILNVLRNHTYSKPDQDNTSFYDDNYWYFKVYWSPAFDGR
jgi:hypothetical protein